MQCFVVWWSDKEPKYDLRDGPSQGVREDDKLQRAGSDALLSRCIGKYILLYDYEVTD